ncbi:MAG: hypothetical protein K8H86_10545 [Ignavibacteriaceae bacterium]|nr:hypothetical protein [Ignavibacteriaceae bacterium]
MLKNLFLLEGFFLLTFWGCSEKQTQTSFSVSENPVSKIEKFQRSNINFDFSIELQGEPIDTTGEIWNVRGIDIYQNDSPEPLQKIINLNTLTPVGSDFSGGFMVDDYNFDGTADFRLIKFDRNTDEVKYLFWLFDKNEKKFVHCFLLDSIPSPQFDYSNSLIFSEHQTDSSLTSDSYKFIDGTPQIFERSIKTISDDSIRVKYYRNEGGKLIFINEEK